MKIVRVSSSMLQHLPSDLYTALLPFTAAPDISGLSGTCRHVRIAIKATVFQNFRQVFSTKDSFEDVLPFAQILTALGSATNFGTATKRSREELVCFSAALGLEEFLIGLFKAKSELVNSRASDGSFALHLAVVNGQETIVKLLVKREADLSTKDRFGRTPAMLAAKLGETEIFGILITAGSDITVEDFSMKTIWHYAIGNLKKLETDRFRRLAILRILAERAANKIALLSEDQARTDSRKKLELLMKQVEGAVGRISESSQAEFLSVIFGAFRSLGKNQTLLKFSQESPLIRAVSAKNLDALKIILAAGGEGFVDQTSHSGKSALFVASELGFDEGIKLLLKAFASVAVSSTSGRNALHACVEHGNVTALNLLLERSSVADITRKCNSGISPFMLAENRGKQGMVQLMLSRYLKLVTDKSSCLPENSPHPYLDALLTRKRPSSSLGRRPTSARLRAAN
jgi:ankyrin repeat protein